MAKDRDREVAFANESFLIGLLQAVSGGAMVAVIAQAAAFRELAGKYPALIFLTAMALALLAAVSAAYYKHEYKKWDVKAQASAEQGKEEEAETRSGFANRDLDLMRNAMLVAVWLIGAGIVVLLVAMWMQALLAGDL